jgi:hypothetical protein
MLWTTDVPQTAINWHDTWLEVQELFEAICKLDLRGIVDESCDVYTFTMCTITNKTGIALPVFWTSAVNRWVKRGLFFKEYLERAGLEYKLEYLRYGANYKKAHKRRKVVELAIKDQLLQ